MARRSDPRATADVTASYPNGRLAGDGCSTAPTWPGGSRCPPGGRPAAGGCRAAYSQRLLRGAIPVRRPAIARRAPRALEDVERVVTGR
jgi:hypothetical protein